MKPFILLGFSLNVISSISIVQLNKYVYKHFSSAFVTNLVFGNFLVTLACLASLKKLNVLTFHKVSLRDVLSISFALCFFSLLSQFSLQINSIGTYQCLSALSTPAIMLASILLYKRNYSKKIQQTMVNQITKT